MEFIATGIESFLDILPLHGRKHGEAFKHVVKDTVSWSSNCTRPPRPVAQLIKTQRQKLGFNLKVREAKQPATGSYLYLCLK